VKCCKFQIQRRYKSKYIEVIIKNSIRRVKLLSIPPYVSFDVSSACVLRINILLAVPDRRAGRKAASPRHADMRLVALPRHADTRLCRARHVARRLCRDTRIRGFAATRGHAACGFAATRGFDTRLCRARHVARRDTRIRGFAVTCARLCRDTRALP